MRSPANPLFFLLGITITLALGAVLVACGARQISDENDPIALLRQGRFAEARALAQKQNPQDQHSRAIIALSLVAEAPTPERGKKAVDVLTKETRDVRAAAVASEMLDLAFELPPPDTEASLALAEVALGATSYGPFAPDTKPSLTVGAASRDLALSVLERVALGLENIKGGVDSARLLTIWNSCFSLTGGSFESSDDRHAWRLFQSISTMAVFMKSANTDSDLADVLLNAAVTVIDANPEIAVPARCDIGSPYDNLKKAMAYNREDLARLENAVKDATGCTRGTYAPTGK